MDQNACQGSLSKTYRDSLYCANYSKTLELFVMVTKGDEGTQRNKGNVSVYLSVLMHPPGDAAISFYKHTVLPIKVKSP